MGQGSARYYQAKADDSLMTTKEAAETLGTGQGWVRKHLKEYEWHHCNLEYGGSAIAYFYDTTDVLTLKEMAEGETEIDEDLLTTFFTVGSLKETVDSLRIARGRREKICQVK